jgi:hypothetical protein
MWVDTLPKSTLKIEASIKNLKIKGENNMLNENQSPLKLAWSIPHICTFNLHQRMNLDIVFFFL